MSDERDAPQSMGERATELAFALPLQEPTVVRRGGGHPRVLLVAIVALIAVAGAVLVTKGSDATGPGEALAAAQAVLEDDVPYAVDITLRFHEADPDEDVPADTGLRVGAEVASPLRWRALDSEFEDKDVYETTERRRVDDELYVQDREAGTDGWDVMPVPPPPERPEEFAQQFELIQEQAFDDEEKVVRDLGLAFFAHILPIAYDPAEVERLVLQATDPAVEDGLEGGGTRLAVTVAPMPEIAAVAEQPIDPMALTLDLDAEHRPQAARFELAKDGNTAVLELAFSAWGEAVTVEAPVEAEVERTPWVDEAALEAVDPDLLVLPEDVPVGRELIWFEIVEEELDGDIDCTSATAEYFTREEAEPAPADEEDTGGDGRPVTIYLSPLECNEDETFDLELAGRPAAYVDGGEAMVLVDETVVEIDSDLEPRQLEQVVASLEQVTADELPARFPDWLPEVVASLRV